MSNILNVDKNNFEAEVISSDKPVIIDFWASWCGPCKMLAPIFEEVAGETDSVKFAKVNVDEASDLASQFRIMSIPTLVIMKDGKPVKKSMGLISKQEMKELLENI